MKSASDSLEDMNDVRSSVIELWAVRTPSKLGVRVVVAGSDVTTAVTMAGNGTLWRSATSDASCSAVTVREDESLPVPCLEDLDDWSEECRWSIDVHVISDLHIISSKGRDH